MIGDGAEEGIEHCSVGWHGNGFLRPGCGTAQPVPQYLSLTCERHFHLMDWRLHPSAQRQSPQTGATSIHHCYPESYQWYNQSVEIPPHPRGGADLLGPVITCAVLSIHNLQLCMVMTGSACTVILYYNALYEAFCLQSMFLSCHFAPESMNNWCLDMRYWIVSLVKTLHLKIYTFYKCNCETDIAWSSIYLHVVALSPGSSTWQSLPTGK